MKKPEWKDCTARVQGETDRTPRVWELKSGEVRLCVHRHIYHHPSDWLLTASELGIDKQLLTSRDVEEAKTEAITFALNKVIKLFKAVEGMRG